MGNGVVWSIYEYHQVGGYRSSSFDFLVPHGDSQQESAVP